MYKWVAMILFKNGTPKKLYQDSSLSNVHQNDIFY